MEGMIGAQGKDGKSKAVLGINEDGGFVNTKGVNEDEEVSEPFFGRLK